MKTTNDTAEFFGQFSGKGIEALSLWMDANQKLVRELADLSASTVKEGADLCAQLQSSALESVKAGQAFWLRQQGDLAKWKSDPMGCYHTSLLEAIQETQKSLKVCQDSFQAMTQTVEHIQAASEKTAKEIQQTCSTLATGMKAVYSPAQS
jgi:methyl-accepting chemotaxis protein